MIDAGDLPEKNKLFIENLETLMKDEGITIKVRSSCVKYYRKFLYATQYPTTGEERGTSLSCMTNIKRQDQGLIRSW